MAKVLTVAPQCVFLKSCRIPKRKENKLISSHVNFSKNRNFLITHKVQEKIKSKRAFNNYRKIS